MLDAHPNYLACMTRRAMPHSSPDGSSIQRVGTRLGWRRDWTELRT